MMQKRWRRLLAVFLVSMLVLGACGGRDDDDGDAAPSDDDTPADTDDTDDTDDDTGDDGDDEPPGDPEPGPGFDGETIRLGVLTPTSGTVAVIGDPLTAGNQAYVDYLNEELGGIDGQYPVELVVEDSAYDPTTAGQRYAAISDEVVAFLQILGTPVVNALLPDLIEDNIIAGPASLDSAWIREPNLMPIGGPYQVQAINAVDWYFSQPENEDQVLCTLASDDEYGDTGVAGVEFAAENLGIDVAVQAEYPAPSATRPAQTFESQIGQLEGGDCEVIFFVATPTDTAPLNTVLTENTDYNPMVLGQSPTWLGLFAGFEYLQENFILASEGTDYGDESVPGMAELVRIKDTYAPEQEPDLYFNFGYLQAMAMHQILEEAVARGDLSREGIMDAMENVGTLSFDGLFGDYVYGTADERQPPTSSSFFAPNPDSPMGLELVERDYEADYVGDFTFE
ncbi:MAG: ABC transporter substrate-binding protein [Acidimicrobiales bacterium]